MGAAGSSLVYGDDLGYFAGAYRADGSFANKAIRVPNGGGFDGLSQFTIAFWLWAAPPNYSVRLFSLGEASGYTLAGAPFAARLRETGSELIFQVSDGVVTGQRRSSVPFPRGDGEYHHVAFVYNGSPARLEIYLDGELVNGSLAGTHPAHTKLNTQLDLYLLGYRGGGPTTLLNGEMDEFVMYDRALSAQEIAALQTLPAGQLVYWFQRTLGNSETISPLRAFVP
jgi:hypothetical protein